MKTYLVETGGRKPKAFTNREQVYSYCYDYLSTLPICSSAERSRWIGELKNKFDSSECFELDPFIKVEISSID